jgi:hypothetical protein
MVLNIRNPEPNRSQLRFRLYDPRGQEMVFMNLNAKHNRDTQRTRGDE